MNNSCPECGFPLQGNERNCPECGLSLQTIETFSQTQTAGHIPSLQKPMNGNSEVINSSGKTDWANYIYECALIFWNVFCKKYAEPHGRASRREFWSFIFMTAFLSIFGLGIILIIPYICVTIRRLHDINRCGWWCLVPLAPFFMYLKKSDEGMNKYGMPYPAQNMIF